MFSRTSSATSHSKTLSAPRPLVFASPASPKDRTEEFFAYRRGSSSKQSPGGTADLWHLLCAEYVRKDRDISVLQPREVNPSVRECTRCSTPFGGLFSSTKGQLQCPLCLELYCVDCLSRKIPLDQPAITALSRMGLEDEAKKGSIS